MSVPLARPQSAGLQPHDAEGLTPRNAVFVIVSFEGPDA